MPLKKEIFVLSCKQTVKIKINEAEKSKYAVIM